MKIVHPICCGVDVHKNSIVATIAATDKNNVTAYLQRTFTTLNPDLYAFRDRLLENNRTQVCMESTGKYWIPMFNILETHVRVLLTHPKYVRAIKGRKTGKKKMDRIIESIRGCDAPTGQRFKMDEAKAHMDYLDGAIARTEVGPFIRVRPYPGPIDLLASMPGIKELSAALILSEIGTDMDVFEGSGHLCSWAGLTPANNESAGKKKSTGVSRAGVFLKPLLVQCALAAVKDRQEPYFAGKYRKIKKRRGHKKAIIAIARMMLTCIYHMLKNGEYFDPGDYEELKNPAPKVYRLTESVAIGLLEEQGYDVSVLQKVV